MLTRSEQFHSVIKHHVRRMDTVKGRRIKNAGFIGTGIRPGNTDINFCRNQVRQKPFPAARIAKLIRHAEFQNIGHDRDTNTIKTTAADNQLTRGFKYFAVNGGFILHLNINIPAQFPGLYKPFVIFQVFPAGRCAVKPCSDLIQK